MEVQELQNLRNNCSKQIGKAKASGENIQPLLDEVAGFGDQMKQIEERLAGIQAELQAIVMRIPNIPDESVPTGSDESDNREERRWGTPPEFDFEVRTMSIWVSAAAGLISKRPRKSPVPAS